MTLIRPEKPSSVRSRSMLTGGLTSAFARGLNLAAGLVTIPIALAALGGELFGVYFTITSLLVLLGFLNFGLGQGLVTGIAEAQSRGERTVIQSDLSNALAISTLTSILVLGAATGGILSLDWPKILGAAGSVSRVDTRSAVLIAVTCTLINIPASIAASVRLGLQESASANLWMGASGVFQVAAVLAASSVGANLATFVAAVALPPLLCNTANSIQLYFGKRTWLRPRWSLMNRSTSLRIFRKGGLFVALALAGAIAFQTDVLVLSHVLGPEAVTEYAVPFRLFAILPILSGLLATPLWPAYADAAARLEHAWARRVFRRALLLAGAVGLLGSILLLAIGRSVLTVWVGTAVQPSSLLLVALGLYAAVQCLAAPLAVYLNGLGVVAFQVMAVSAMAVVNLPLSILLAHVVGVPGPVLASVIAQTFCVLLPCAFFIPRLMRARSATPLVAALQPQGPG